MKCSYFTGYMELLKQLTVVGDVSREQFEGILRSYFRDFDIFKLFSHFIKSLRHVFR